MYNRYIPQADGSFLRKRIEDTHRPPDPEPPTLPPPPPCNAPPPEPPRPQQPRVQRSNDKLAGFFSQLLPKNFDTGDLIVVLLLLLMAADHPDDQNTALLTLALYLFL